MKKLDKLILLEMIGPWAFGVAVFTTLILAGTFLPKLTKLLVSGAPFSIALSIAGLLVPAIMTKTFSMAALLAPLMAFGRLSGDSELVAVKASGTSFIRMIYPVAFFGAAVTALAFTITEALVPIASYRAVAMESDLAAKLTDTSLQPQSYPIYEKGKLIALVSARDFDFADKLLKGATIVSYNKKGKPSFLMLANQLKFKDEKEWKIQGGAKLFSADGKTFIKIKDEAWPNPIPKARFTPSDIISRKLKNADSLSMKELKEQLLQAKNDPYFDPDQYGKLEFGYWNKISLPLAALVFSLVGAALGVKPHRTSMASGFILAILISFSYLLLTNFMSAYSRSGLLPAYAASFTPTTIGLIIGIILIYRKNH